MIYHEIVYIKNNTEFKKREEEYHQTTDPPQTTDPRKSTDYQISTTELRTKIARDT